MTTSQSPTTNDGDDFVCECDESHRSACNEESFYKEHDSKRYCVLHYPSIEKKEDFQKALKRKISEGDFDFRGVWFPDKVSFENFAFGANANFSHAHFRVDSDFSGAQFSEYANFSNAQFSGDAKFSESANFSKSANFSYAQFIAYANFSTAKFSGDADFVGARFFANADFSRAHFSAYAQFVGTQFIADAYFREAQINATANFLEAVFKGNAYFLGTRFIEKDGSLDRSANSKDKAISSDDKHGAKTNIINVTFVRTRFKDGVSFEKNTFSGQTLLTFAAAVFEKPERVTFHTVALCPHWFVDVDSREFNFSDVGWGLRHWRDRWDAVRKEIKALKRRQTATKPSLLAITFRQLAVNAEVNNRYEEAANFRYMAMDVKRIERGFIKNLFSLSWWYWALSGYGERVIRAFIALVVIWFLFAVFYWSSNATWWQPNQASKIAAESNAGEKQPTAVMERELTTITRPLTPFEAFIYSVSVTALQKPEPFPANTRAKGLVLLETVLGPLQAALLALAIRRKFMR